MSFFSRRSKSRSPSLPEPLRYDQVTDHETSDDDETFDPMVYTKLETKINVNTTNTNENEAFTNGTFELDIQPMIRLQTVVDIYEEEEFDDQTIIEKFKIALTFLLHQESPLNHNHNTTDAIQSFKRRCLFYNNDLQNDDTYNYTTYYNHLQSMYCDEYEADYNILYDVWIRWRQYADANGCFIDKDIDAPYLEECCDEYVWDLEDQTTHQSAFTLRAMMGISKKFRSDSPKHKKKKKNKRDKGDLRMPQSQKSQRRISHIKTVNSIQSMKEWIEIHKDNDHKKPTHCCTCNSTDNKLWIKSKGSDLMPMYMWQWEDVVAFVDDHDDIKHFASLLYQYKIDGKELCTMTQKQIEYLIECSLINNHKLNEANLDALRTNTQQQQVIWPITQEAKLLKQHVDKVRIRQHIICRYHLAIDLMKHLLKESQYPGIQEDAEKIYTLIQLLRVDVRKGPNHFWKMESAPFFNKIDNFIAVLLAPKRLRRIFRKCFPDFLEPQSEAELQNPNKNNVPMDGTQSTPLEQNRIRPLERPQHNVSADTLDICVDKICKGSNFTHFIHNIDRFYLKIMTCFISVVLMGVIMVSIWYYASAIYQCDIAMSMSIQVIGKRTRDQMLYQFWIPQMIMNTAISAIKHSTSLTKYAAIATTVFDEDRVFEYDQYIASFSTISATDNIWAFWLYNNDTNGFIGAFRDNEEIVISEYNGSCRIEWYYDPDRKQRNLQRPYDMKCTFRPRERPWYILAVDELGINAAGWTKPYPFADRDFAGMSLVSSFINNGTLLILLSEITINTLSSASSVSDPRGITLHNLPIGSILMMVSHSLDVLLSSEPDQVDVISTNDANCVYTACQSNNELIVSSMNYIRYNYNYFDNNTAADVVNRLYDEDNGYYYSIFPFKMIYLNMFSESTHNLILNDSVAQYGYVVIANDSEFFHLIDIAWYTGWCVCVFMLLCGIAHTCWQIKYDIKKGMQNLSVTACRSQLIYENKKSEHALMALRAINTFSHHCNPQALISIPSESLIKVRRCGSVDILNDGVNNLKCKKALKAMSIDTYLYTKDEAIHPEIGDKVRTRCGEIGVVQCIGKALKDGNMLVAIHNDDGQCIFVALNDIESIIAHDTCTATELKDSADTKEEKEDTVSDDDDPFIKQVTPQYMSRLSTETAISPSRRSPSPSRSCGETCYLSKNNLLFVTWIEILITFIVVGTVWELLSAQAVDTLLSDIMAKHEYNHVSDQVYNMFDVSNKMASTFQSRYQNLIHQNNEIATDHFFINMMKSYVRSDSAFSPFMIYVGLPDGGFRGVLWEEDELVMVRRDKETEWARTYSKILNGDIVDYNAESKREYLYDPRCRPWYTSAISNTFSGTIHEAFPNNSFENFYYDEGHASLTANCKSAKIEYMQLFNITHNDSFVHIPQADDYNELLIINNSNYSMAWSRYIFAELVTIGLTASAPILDENGSVVAVVSIDWVLGNLGDILQTSTGNKTDWFSWIIEANDDLPSMIASSDGVTLTDTQSLEGCLTFTGGDAEEQVPYVCTDHPQYIIRVMCKQLLQVEGRDISILPILNNEIISQQIRVPMGLPMLEAGRIQYYFSQYFNDIPFNVDWVIFKSIDISHLAIDDMRFAIILFGTLMFCVCIVFARFYQQNQQNADHITAYDGTDSEFNTDRKRDLIAVMNKLKPIIYGSATAIWTKLYKDYDGILSTNIAQDFCANRANQHIAAHDANKYHSLLIKCSWESSTSPSASLKNHINDMIDSNIYNGFIVFVIVCHLILSLFEPPTPTQLQQEGINAQVLIGIIICLFIEYIDLLLIGIKRFIEFSLDKKSLLRLYELNYDIHHRYVHILNNIPPKWDENDRLRAFYLVYRGPKSVNYMAHIILLILMLFNLMLTVFARIAIFSYYIPIIPFLFILRNKHIKQFGRDFAHALYHSTDVIFSYFCFIALFSVFAMSLLNEIEKTETDLNLVGFDTISHAVVSAFVYISTAENYSTIYSIFDSEYYWSSLLLLYNALSFLLICGMLGLFCFIPMIIHRFEEAFSECGLKQKRRHHFRKTNCIIAAFIMLDMNNDLTIDKAEMKQLISKSILLNKNKVFDVFKRDNDNDDVFNPDDDDAYGVQGIDLKTFVDYLLTQKLRSKLLANSVPFQSRFQALLECNVFRRSWFNLCIFVVCVVPVVVVSMLKGLNGVNNDAIDVVMVFFFLLNFAEMNLRWFAFGLRRFWDLQRYPNPNYVVSAINKYYTSKKLAQLLGQSSGDSNDVIRLTSNQRRWAAKYLKTTKPLSSVEKSRLTLMHRIELCCIYVTLTLYVVSIVLCNKGNAYAQEGYQTYFLQFGVLLRTFTLLKANQKLTFSVFTVFPQFMALLIFLALYIYIWARLGCALFGDNVTAIVIEDVYDAAPNIVANFDTIGYSVLCLVQLMVGEGWHEVMYLNVIATSYLSAIYFIIYITVVTIIISNVFVGLFLAGIDDLEMQQSEMQALEKCIKSNKSFKKYAIDKLNVLKYRLSEHKDQVKKTKQQIKHISFLLKQHRKYSIYNAVT